DAPDARPVLPRAAGAPEGDVVDVGRVENQLDPHEDPQRVAAGGDAEQAETEEEGAQDHEVRDRESLHQPLISLRETVTAPMSATRSTRDAISNGSAKSVRKAFPTPYVVGSGPPGPLSIQVARSAIRTSAISTAPTRTAPTPRPTERLDTRTSAMRCVSMMAKRLSTRMPPT